MNPPPDCPFNADKYRPTPVQAMTRRAWPDRRLNQAPIWASVDLRDGNQALLEPMDPAQKLKLWDTLVAIGVKEIEVGFPAASQTDYDFVRRLIDEQRIPDDVTVQVLVQAREALIERTFEALRGVKRAIVHTYNSTSTVQRERVFGMNREQITEIAVNGARWLQHYARRYPDTDWIFQYSPESYTNTEWDYAVAICNAVIDVWRPTADHRCIINLPATVESSTPNVFADQIEHFCRHVNRRDAIIVSLHTHNDRGSAVAAAELGLLAGADRVEGTLLGNGERTGNMDLITLAMNLYSQGIDPQLNLSNPDAIIHAYQQATGMPVHPRHPWVGELVYTAFSGSHQDAIRKCLKAQRADEPWQVAYLPIDPRDIGRDYQAVVRVNSQSGKGGVAFVLERDYGLSLPRWMQMELAPVVQQASEACGGEIDSARIHALFQTHFVVTDGPLKLRDYRIERHHGKDRIEAQIARGAHTDTLQGQGEGVIAAFVDGWRQTYGVDLGIVDYSEHAVGEGTHALAVTYMMISADGQRLTGAAFDQDTVSSSIKAVLACLNRAPAAAHCPDVAHCPDAAQAA